MNRAIFMDRDGVINKWEHGDIDVPESWYVLSWEQFEFLPGAKEAMCKILRDTGYSIMVISNQSGIGRGFVDFGTVYKIFSRMQEEVLLDLDVEYTEMPFWSDRFDFYFCPHAPDAGCACRKPSPGMIYKAAIEHEIDLSRSWMIGDSNTDIEAGHRAGVGNMIKILDSERHELFKKYAEAQANGRMVIGPYLPPESERQCSFFCLDLKRAVEYILENES